MVAPSKVTDARVSVAAAGIDATKPSVAIRIIANFAVLVSLGWPLRAGEAINGVFNGTLIDQGAALFLFVSIELDHG